MNNIVPIRSNGVYRQLRGLADDADVVLRRYDELETASDKAQAELSEYDKQLLASCKEALELLDAESNYEDDDRDYSELRRNVIKARLAMLIGAFPNGAPSDPDVYVRVMLEHVCSMDSFCLPALDAACYDIVATQRFLPTVSEVVAAITQHQERWSRRFWAISQLAERSRRAIARIERLEEAAQLQAAQQRAAAKTRDVEQARLKLEQARRDLADENDAYCDACSTLRECEERIEQAQLHVHECESELAQAELAERAP
ncbi:hypothetical protein I6F20_17015 [Bradyrhizobium sp. IC3123]|uniref:hypothetical protein n=1 Tax=Bradyrhizobium sp. IC3123 TaxID=2793803 RepID=UPI001CD369A8|nr:hypothetical protein [Bradyrhizobium sp. IC3123]MCA1390769.1 hypothetical protein [Bradyrhizobium sp. IC3123]